MREMRRVELEEVWDRELTKRIVQRRTTRDRATARWERARAKRHEAKALSHAASEDYQKYLKQQARIKMAQEQEQVGALDHGIVVKEEGPPDIVRDIQWVYDNWGDLFVITENGARVFDTEVLEKAPSNGAITMAEYALRKPDGFVERFVSRLLPKDAGEQDDVQAQTNAERLAELDPSLDDMRDFFK